MLNTNYTYLLFLALLLSISKEQCAHPAVAIAVVKTTTAAASKGSFMAVIKAAISKIGLAGATKAVGGKAAAAVTSQAVAGAASTSTAAAISATAPVAAAAQTTTVVAIKTSIVVSNSAASAAGVVGAAITTSAIIGAHGAAATSSTGQLPVPPNQNDQQVALTREQVKKALEEKLDELWAMLKEKGVPAIRSVLLGKILSNTFDYFSGEKEKTEIYRNNIDMLNNEIKKLREEDAQKQQRADELVIEIKKIHGLLISMKQG